MFHVFSHDFSIWHKLRFLFTHQGYAGRWRVARIAGVITTAGWNPIFEFQRACQGYVPRRMRVGDARHVLRGSWGVGTLQLCLPQSGAWKVGARWVKFEHFHVEKSYRNWTPERNPIIPFRRAFQGCARRRMRVGGVRHVLRGCEEVLVFYYSVNLRCADGSSKVGSKSKC